MTQIMKYHERKQIFKIIRVNDTKVNRYLK